MTTEPKVIGIIQYVQLPDLVGQPVPAKVDTGAYDSAIWASQIKEEKGILQFTLFNQQSAFYNGHVIRTSEYRCTKVKNSFGESEQRYKVKLKLKIANKIYKATFNLSDRSRSRFPILLGAQFLKRRFIVDVSKKNFGTNDEQNKNKLVVIMISRLSEASSEFFEQVRENMTDELLVVHYNDLSYEINQLLMPKITLPDGRDIAEASLVYIKARQKYSDQAVAITRYLKYRHVPFFDRELEDNMSSSKLSELFILATRGIPVPPTQFIAMNNSKVSYETLRKDFGKKFVIKDPTGDRGKNNFLVVNQTSYQEAMSRLKGINHILVQKYIENDGFLRVLLMGNDVVQIIQRKPIKHDDPLKEHLNKPHGGVNAIEIPESEYESDFLVLAQKAAIVMKRDIAGVDLMKDKKTKKWYILEVNYNPTVIHGINVARRARGLSKLLSTYDERI
jgi:glutathione synthase/RimK-type ligase-like ATP-grasp enzyme